MSPNKSPMTTTHPPDAVTWLSDYPYDLRRLLQTYWGNGQ